MKSIQNILMAVALFLQVGAVFASPILNRINNEKSNSKLDYDEWEHNGPTREDILASKGSPEDKLISAARSGDLKTVETLIAAGAKIDVTDTFNFTALFHAVEGGHAEIVKLLIAHGAAKNQKNFGELFVSAVYKGNNEVVKALLVEASRIDKDTLKMACGLTRNSEIKNAIKELLAKSNS